MSSISSETFLCTSGCFAMLCKQKKIPCVLVLCPQNIKKATSSRISSFVSGFSLIVACKSLSGKAIFVFVPSKLLWALVSRLLKSSSPLARITLSVELSVNTCRILILLLSLCTCRRIFKYICKIKAKKGVKQYHEDQLSNATCIYLARFLKLLKVTLEFPGSLEFSTSHVSDWN